ncbi:MAG: hypothetical protein HY324_03460, partial [Chlamydiia bacterium]|nr:hypothetical protein [Chlamydiia bacterium]
VRKLLLPYFKENLNPAIRSKLWDEYVELTVEARRLKEIVEEESSFAIEQIELAVQQIEKEIAQLDELIERTSLPRITARMAIGKKEELYITIQKQLSFLNTWATRLNALRKEVMKTGMRIRFKTKLFKQISHLGDLVFPKRKELIEKMSKEFEQDVETFISAHFQGEQIVGAPYYQIREEIKALQGMAKFFTLSSPIFHKTRQKLSECWDQIRVLEKEHKKESLEKKRVFTEERAVKVKEEQEKAKIFAEEEKERIRLQKESLEKVQEAIRSLQEEMGSLDSESVTRKLEVLKKEIEKLLISEWEKRQLFVQVRRLQNLYATKKEEATLNGAEGNSLENLQLVLQQKRERRQEMKETLDGYRKQLGGSSLDFQKSIHLREWMDME